MLGLGRTPDRTAREPAPGQGKSHFPLSFLMCETPGDKLFSGVNFCFAKSAEFENRSICLP